MSLVVVVYVPTGIVISSDSRTTAQMLHGNPHAAGQAALPVFTQLVLSDSTEKVFLVGGRFGIATFGDARAEGFPMAHHIDRFAATAGRDWPSVRGATEALLKYMRQLTPVPKCAFVVAGYDVANPNVFVVDVGPETVVQVNSNAKSGQVEYGIVRAGDTAVVNRLIGQAEFNPNYSLMSLQDAVDFSRHLIQTTISQMRFELRYATVGGPIDTLALTPRSCEFLSRKRLGIGDAT